MSITLNQVLALVGKLDDTQGDEAPRERFRRFLRENVGEIGQVRDYVEDCLRNSGDQYNRALQDLVNHVGHLLGFKVTFGRYHGVQGQIGFDGHWRSPKPFHFVVEVKTTEAYAIKTATLIGYVDALIGERQVPSWDAALGLYVVGRPDPEIRQLENAIVAEKRTNQLRIISVDSLLSLAEMMHEYDVSHEDIMAVVRPSEPTIDSIVELMARLVAQRRSEEPLAEETLAPAPLTEQGKIAYWITPVRNDTGQSAEEVIQALVGGAQRYAFGERTPGRNQLGPGDWMCFYASGKGVVAHAKVSSAPTYQVHPLVPQTHDPGKYPWVFSLENPVLYLGNPVVLDATLRNNLEAFQGRDSNKPWSWFVQATHKITEHDFGTLTRPSTSN